MWIVPRVFTDPAIFFRSTYELHTAVRMSMQTVGTRESSTQQVLALYMRDAHEGTSWSNSEPGFPVTVTRHNSLLAALSLNHVAACSRQRLSYSTQSPALHSWE